MKDTVLATLTSLIEDYHSFNPSQVPTSSYPTPLAFCKQVNRGLPCVYNLPSSHESFPGSSWTRSTLLDAVHDPVEVAITPDGRADSLQTVASEEQPVFLQPASVQMTLAQLLDTLIQPQNSPVHYLQSQNGNLNSDTPLTPLLRDLPSNLPFAEPVLGPPEAINIWLGDDRSVTSMHRDPYENLYLVLKGSKTFTLYAPVDEVALCAEHVRTGRHVYDSDTSTFCVAMDDSAGTIPWIPIDPMLPRDEIIARYPLYGHARPQTVTVNEGQVLYLPSGWFHHVQQKCGRWEDGSVAPCIAVNYWYDQEYEGEQYVMRQHVGRRVGVLQDETRRGKQEESMTGSIYTGSQDSLSGPHSCIEGYSDPCLKALF